MKKTVLLLGGNGFLGTNILKYIDDHLSDKYQVIIFDKFPENRLGVRFRCVSTTFCGDFSDSVLMEKILNDNPIDLVIHSLSTTVPALSLNARYDVESNLVPTIELLNCMVRNKVNKIVYISSGGAVYGNSENVRHKETEDVFPISSYGVVKLAIEKYLMQYAELYGMKPLIIRLSNPYGPYHFSKCQGICNVAMDAALSREKFEVWGAGTAMKDYIYVDDFVEIMFRLISLETWNQVINVASGCMASVNQILEQIKELIPTFEWSYGDASKFDVSHFELDMGKLHSIIGGYDFIPIQDGLKKLLEWEKSVL